MALCWLVFKEVVCSFDLFHKIATCPKLRQRSEVAHQRQHFWNTPTTRCHHDGFACLKASKSHGAQIRGSIRLPRRNTSPSCCYDCVFACSGTITRELIGKCRLLFCTNISCIPLIYLSWYNTSKTYFHIQLLLLATSSVTHLPLPQSPSKIASSRSSSTHS